MKYIPLPKNRSHLSERDRKIISNLGLVKMVINQLNPFCLNQTLTEFDDLFSEGVIGLAKAVDRFNPDLGNKFSGFAVPYIRGEILRHFERRWFVGGIRISRNQVWSKTFRLSVFGLDQPLSDDSDETFLDSKESLLNPSIQTEDAIWVESMLEQLKERQRSVIKAIYFDGLLQKEVAEVIGVSEICVSRDHKSGIKKLRELSSQGQC